MVGFWHVQRNLRSPAGLDLTLGVEQATTRPNQSETGSLEHFGDSSQKDFEVEQIAPIFYVLSI
jgi:hypothetical protein